VSAGLQGWDDGDSPARCFVCNALAVGPCARCRRPVCGDCCELTAGGAKTYAFCAGCVRRGGLAIRRGWLAVLVWMSAPVLLAGLVLLVLWLARGE
jgi:hypothetical protein